MNIRQLVAVAAVALVVGFVARGLVFPAGAGTTVVRASSVVGPSRLEEGVGMGFARTADGARAAAAVWVAATARVARLGAVSRAWILERIAGKERAADMARWFEPPAEYSMIDSMLAPYTIGGAVLFDATDECSAQRCRVRQYAAYVVLSIKTQTPVSWFQRNVVELEWRDGDWRFARAERSVGPMPAMIPQPSASASAEAQAQLDEVLR